LDTSGIVDSNGSGRTVGNIEGQSTAVNGLHDQGHSHTYNLASAPAGNGGLPSDSNNYGYYNQMSTNTGYANLAGDSETRPKNIAVNYCIKY
jgi:hypothetical protein